MSKKFWLVIGVFVLLEVLIQSDLSSGWLHNSLLGIGSEGDFVSRARQIAAYQMISEIVYVIVMGLIGLLIGKETNKRQRSSEENNTSEPTVHQDVKRARWIALGFLICSVLYLTTAWLPGWIGRNVIFFAGYYFGVSGKQHS